MRNQMRPEEPVSTRVLVEAETAKAPAGVFGKAADVVATRIPSMITEAFENAKEAVFGHAHGGLGRAAPLAASALMLLTAEALSPAQAQTTPTIHVTAQLGSNGLTIPPNFVGFNADEYDIAYGTTFACGPIYTPSNTSLISLLRWLGPQGVVRVGGGYSDDVPPDPITQDSINQLAGFLQALGPGWNLIYGLNAAVNDPNLAVQHTGYLLNALPASRFAIQIGNEPDLHYSYNEQVWVNVFDSYVQALAGAFGQLNYGAPDTSGTFDGLSWPSATVLGADGFQYLTSHKYTLPYGCNYGQGGVPSVQSMFADANEPSLPNWSITEFGIICDGGLNGVTNVLIAATYYLELAQTTAAGGWAGIMAENVVMPHLWGDGKTRTAYYNQWVVLPDGSYAPQGMFMERPCFRKSRVSRSSMQIRRRTSAASPQ
jgi:hypothetical protein